MLYESDTLVNVQHLALGNLLERLTPPTIEWLVGSFETMHYIEQGERSCRIIFPPSSCVYSRSVCAGMLFWLGASLTSAHWKLLEAPKPCSLQQVVDSLPWAIEKTAM